jgi:hypothetical protein
LCTEARLRHCLDFIEYAARRTFDNAGIAAAPGNNRRQFIHVERLAAIQAGRYLRALVPTCVSIGARLLALLPDPGVQANLLA